MVATFPLPMVRRAVAENQHGSPRVAVFFSRLCGSYLCCCVKPAQPGHRCSGRAVSSSLRRRLEA